MQPVSFRDEFEQRVKAGEKLVPVSRIPALADIPDSTRAEWCQSGKLPVTQIGRRYYTIPDLIAKALASLMTARQPKAQPAGRSLRADLLRVKALEQKKAR